MPVLPLLFLLREPQVTAACTALVNLTCIRDDFHKHLSSRKSGDLDRHWDRQLENRVLIMLVARAQVVSLALPDSTAVVKGSSSSGVRLLLKAGSYTRTVVQDEG